MLNLWGSKDDNKPPGENASSEAKIRGEIPPSEASIPGSASGEVIQEHRRRGRKPLTDEQKRERELQKGKEKYLSAFEELYQPETWEGIMSAPADTMLALTGKDRWNLSEKERRVMGNSASLTAKCFAITDPKWLAVSMLCITIMQVYGTRAGMEYTEYLAKRKRNDPLKETKRDETHT